jgi:hypothetical protein
MVVHDQYLIIVVCLIQYGIDAFFDNCGCIVVHNNKIDKFIHLFLSALLCQRHREKQVTPEIQKRYFIGNPFQDFYQKKGNIQWSGEFSENLHFLNKRHQMFTVATEFCQKNKRV